MDKEEDKTEASASVKVKSGLIDNNNTENKNLVDIQKKSIEVEKESIKAETNSEDTKTESINNYDPANVHYENDRAIYTDQKTGYQYIWNAEKQEWEPKNSNISYGFEDDTHTYTDADGTKFFWDKEKNAWFPKINDDFMAIYQMNYGFFDNKQGKECSEGKTQGKNDKLRLLGNQEPTENLKKYLEKEERALHGKKYLEKQEANSDMEENFLDKQSQNNTSKKGEKRKASDPTWFELDEKQNTKVYVSNLPLDITEEEFVDLMQKYGIIMKDVNTGKLKIKLYTEPNSNYLKGDALCTYVRVESVDLAINLLDGYDLRGKKIKVERAKFQMKGEYDPKLKPKQKKKKEKLKLKKMQEKLFDWRPEKMRGERSKHERIIIIRNVFDPDIFDKDVGLILEYQQDLREECSKCGEVRKVIIYDRHPEGVAQVNMKEPEEADACVQMLNGRWFNKRQLKAEIWDGKTKFKVAETDSQISQRLTNWDKFLEDDEVKSEDKKVEDGTSEKTEVKSEESKQM